MQRKILTVPCLTDNYAFLIHNETSGETSVVDAPEAKPIKLALSERGWNLSQILVTHHHADHIDGVDELREAYGATVVGGAADAHRLPKLDLAVSEGDSVSVCGESARVLDVSGHTVGHIAFVLPGAAFTADSLMALGCGRVFEGTFPMMWGSLSKLATLPPETMIYSGHEYTASNAKFALTIEPENRDLQDRAKAVARDCSAGVPTVPSRLSLELGTNPFLRANLPQVKSLIGMPDATDAESFAEIRRRKDSF